MMRFINTDRAERAIVGCLTAEGPRTSAAIARWARLSSDALYPILHDLEKRKIICSWRDAYQVRSYELGPCAGFIRPGPPLPGPLELWSPSWWFAMVSLTVLLAVMLIWR